MSPLKPFLKRRAFLKTAASAAAGCMVSSCAYSPSSKNEISFPVDVVTQNSSINQSAVDNTLDACVKTLTQKSSSAEGWAALFQKPSQKSWPEVKATIKFNEVGRNLPRIAIIHKVCRQLHVLGIPYSNIRVYGGPNDSVLKISEYNTLLAELLPDGVIVSQHASALGGIVDTPIPSAQKDAMTITSTKCVAEIADHTNDILINVAVNKGHWIEFGGFTLTMKNHFGTFNPRPYPSAAFKLSHGNLDYLCAITKSDALLGGAPPQQQLCIVDSIWATSALNPGVSGDDTPYNLIIMGTFSPIVDYVTAKKIRYDVMQCELGTVTDTFLSYFGYSDQEIMQLGLVFTSVTNPFPATGEQYMPVKSRYTVNPQIPDERVVGCYNNNIVLG